ncbi:MAG: butyrate kinase [bacterium]|nr:butyrate kinase [bacterium]
MKMAKLLCLNFGSTSTKMAAFENDEKIFSKSYTPGEDGYPKFKNLAEHQEYAIDLAAKNLAEYGLTFEDIDAFVARGGGMMTTSSGTFAINEILIEDTKKVGNEQHPGKLGNRICFALGQKYGKPAFVVNQPSSDELIEEARYTGFKDIYRHSDIHALNQKEVCYRYAASIERNYEDLNLIVCHIGGGISVTAHRKGKMIDSNNIIMGDGPMAPTRSGTIPAIPLIEMCFSGKYEMMELIMRVMKNGGLKDHLGTDDARIVEQRIEEGDEYAKIIYDTMLYQISKYAGEMAVALEGKVDQILITGGMARSKYVTDYISGKLAWIAPSTVIPGEFEMEALAAGAMRVLSGQEEAKEYTGIPVWTPPVVD